MPRHIFTSSFNKTPRALAIFICVVIIIESIVYMDRPNIIKDFWNKFLINEGELLKAGRDYPYLILGDSIQKTGIDTSSRKADILNLGLPGGKPMGLYLELKRYLKTHEAPKAIFLYVDPENPFDSFNVILRYFMSAGEYFSVFFDLSLKEHAVFWGRYYATLDMRAASRVKRQEYQYSNDVFVKKLISNKGYMPIPNGESELASDYFDTHLMRFQTDISITDRDLKYLDKIMKTAEKNNIKVMFFGFVVPRNLHTILERLGFNDKYLEFYSMLKDKYKEAYFVKHPVLLQEHFYFGDQSHFNSKGSRIYTKYFVENMFSKVDDVLGD